MFDIIIPTYKIHPDLIKRCLDSIDTQVFKHHKVYLVDGTPVDWEHYAKFQAIVNDHAVVYLRQTGKGVSQARNQAINAGSNPYVAFLDGDDYWYPEHLNELAQAIDTTDDQYVIWWNPMDTTVVLTTPKNTFTSNKLCNYFANHQDWDPRYHGLFITTHPVFPSSVAVSRTRFDAVGGFPEDLFAGEDVILWHKMLGDSRKNNNIFLCYQTDFVGAYHDLQDDTYGGDTGFFNKGQHPLKDLYGDDAEKVFQENLASRSKYFTFGDKPDDIDQQLWDEIKSAKIYEGWLV